MHLYFSLCLPIHPHSKCPWVPSSTSVQGLIHGLGTLKFASDSINFFPLFSSAPLCLQTLTLWMSSVDVFWSLLHGGLEISGPVPLLEFKTKLLRPNPRGVELPKDYMVKILLKLTKRGFLTVSCRLLLYFSWFCSPYSPVPSPAKEKQMPPPASCVASWGPHAMSSRVWGLLGPLEFWPEAWAFGSRGRS